MEDETRIELLKEIRDLLIPISAHYQPEYEERLRKERDEKRRRLALAVKGDQARSACMIMDGTNDQAAIRRKVGILSGNLSTLISRLEEGEMLASGSDRRKPKLVFDRDELQAIFGGHK